MWSARRTVTKTATVSLHSNSYEVDAALIGRHVELKRAGRTWKGCCPFHGERTPSFNVYTEDKHYKCYGCGEHGNVFTFLQKLQGKEFPEVVRELAAMGV